MKARKIFSYMALIVAPILFSTVASAATVDFICPKYKLKNVNKKFNIPSATGNLWANQITTQGNKIVLGCSAYNNSPMQGPIAWKHLKMSKFSGCVKKDFKTFRCTKVLVPTPTPAITPTPPPGPGGF